MAFGALVQMSNVTVIALLEAASDLNLTYMSNQTGAIAFVPCDVTVVQIGWTWNQGPNTFNNTNPVFVTKYQLKAAALQLNIRNTMETFFTVTATQAQKDWWNLTDNFYRNDSTLEAIRVQLGFTNNQVNTLFTTAAGLPTGL